MSELKAFDIVVAEEGYCEGIVKYRRAVYDKSEADKVIAELKESVKGLILDNYLKDKETRHNKYKRCLAMAEWCESTALWCYQAAHTLPTGFHATLFGKPVMIEPDRLFKRHVLLTKWSARWRELSEKFKEVK